MTAPAVLLPNTDLVGVYWLKRNPKFSAANIGGIATRLPSGAGAQAAMRRGFITTMVVGGAPNMELPIRSPIIAVSCWAAQAAGSQKVPWAQASQLAEWVWEMTYDRAHQNVSLVFSLPGYAHARVMTVVALTEPRRIEGDAGTDARVDIELQLNWTGV